MSNQPNLRYVFFGTPTFARIVLARLLDAGLAPIAVVANPDRPIGRTHELHAPETKTLLRERGLDTPVLQPEKITPEIIEGLHALHADVFVIAAYAHIVPKELLALPAHGAIGVHPSLLPKYRGATPIQSALLHGEVETGTTLFLVDDQVDHGAIVAQQSLPIAETDTYETLIERLATLGGELLIPLLHTPSSILHSSPQDHHLATKTKKFSSADAEIAWADFSHALEGNAEQSLRISRMIRALNPEPGVFTIRPDGKRLKLLAAHLVGGTVVVTKTHLEGKKPMEHREGYRIEVI